MGAHQESDCISPVAFFTKHSKMDSLKVWVGNLPHGVARSFLQVAFQGLGAPKSCNMRVFHRGQAQDMLLSSCVVEYATEQDALAAVAALHQASLPGPPGQLLVARLAKQGAQYRPPWDNWAPDIAQAAESWFSASSIFRLIIMSHESGSESHESTSRSSCSLSMIVDCVVNIMRVRHHEGDISSVSEHQESE